MDDDLKMMMWRTLKIQRTDDVSLHHSLQFVCLQMKQIRELTAEINKYKKEEDEKQRKSKCVQHKLEVKGQMQKVIVPLTKMWKFASTEVSYKGTRNGKQCKNIF